MLQAGADIGLPADELLRHTGLDEAAVRDPQARTSIQQSACAPIRTSV
jgi:hypothetical protein